MTLPHSAFDTTIDEISDYRPICGLAVVGLLLAVVSWLALLWPSWYLAAVLALVVSLLGWRRITLLAPAIVGRGAALGGAFLAIVVLVAVPVNSFVYYRGTVNEAQRFAALWFDALRDGAVEKAHELTMHPRYRQPLSGDLWTYYRANQKPRQLLRQYASRPLVRTLVALGAQVEVRFYQTVKLEETTDGPSVTLRYAVSYSDEKKVRTTFFVDVSLERVVVDKDRTNWRMTATEGGVRPPGF